MAVHFLFRSQWGADPLSVTSGVALPHRQFVGLVIHHTVIDYVVGSDAAAYMRRLQRSRPDLGLEVPYSFVVFESADPNDCIVAEGRGWGRSGAHTVGYNSTAYGVALAGDFTDHAPTPGMLEGIRWLGRQLSDPSAAMPTIGHRDTGYATACPGAAAAPLLDQVQPPFEEEDMALSADDIEAIAQRVRQLVWDEPIQTRRGAYPARNIAGWTKDEVTEPDLLAYRITSTLPAPAGGSVDTAAIAQQTLDLFHQRLSD